MGTKQEGEAWLMGDIRHQLKAEQADLLREAVMRNAPTLEPLLPIVGKRLLTENEREHLRAALADELAATGLTDEDEPNQRGLQIEELIDRLGHLSEMN
jgi:hypothetical protein